MEKLLLFNQYPEDVLLEVFSGKKSEFSRIEELLVPVLAEVKRQSFESGRKGRLQTINKMPETIEIEKLFQKAFRFKKFLLNFYESTLLPPNAFTLPSAARFFDGENRKNMFTSRLAVNERTTVNVHVGAELIRLIDLEPDELVAIILHEIGHDMDVTLMSLMGSVFIVVNSYLRGRLFDSIFQIVNFISANFAGNMANFFKEFGNNIRAYLPDLEKFLMGAMRVLTEIGEGLIILQGSLGSFSMNPFTTLPAHMVMLANPLHWTGYQAEKFADSFATKYGYGPALARALSKLEGNKNLYAHKYVDKIPVIGKPMKDFALLNFSIIGAMMDPHPQLITRVTSQLRNLKEDLKDPELDPRLREELERNTKELEDYIESNIMNPDADPERRRVLRALYARFMYKMTGGRTDIRDLAELISPKTARA